MAKLEQSFEEVVDIGSLKTFQVNRERKVSDLLNELKLSNKYFAILVNGKKAGINDIIKEGSSIVLLPKIAGG